MPTLNYHQTLDMVEAFMIKSGMRAYCTNICKGKCCDGCYTSKDACHKHEGRRMSCSVYMCYFKVRSRGKDFLDSYKIARSIVGHEAQRTFEKYKTGYASHYFNPPPKRMFKAFMIQGYPPNYIEYNTNKTSVEYVKAGLCLKYAAKIKIIMNKVIRLAQSSVGSEIRPGKLFENNPRLHQFEARRVRRNKKLEWEVKYWRAKEWV
jgi:hypothetical protein